MRDTKISKSKYYLLSFFKGVSLILPLLLLVIFRFDHYIYSKKSVICLSIGGFTTAFVIMLTAFNVLHLKGFGWTILLFVLSWFLQDLIVDIQWILLCLALGQVASKIIDFFAQEEKERVLIERGAEANARRNEEVYKKYHGSGRV